MAFTSKLYSGEFLIDDAFSDANHQAVNDPTRDRGRVPRDYNRIPHGALPYAAKFDLPLIPRSEWTARIEEMESTKSRLSDMLLQAGIESLDQDSTNFCWCNAVITAIETMRCFNGLPYVHLSPASVAAPVKGYRNEGGWGGEALEYIVEHGVCTTDLWPANAIKRDYFDPSRANASLHKVSEWYDMPSRGFDAMMTCLLLRLPVPIGLNWWSHEVCAIDPVVITPGKYGVRFRNSWGSGYGSQGFSILTEGKSTPDDAVAPRVTTPSVK